jgi:hypothetical protein
LFPPSRRVISSFNKPLGILAPKGLENIDAQGLPWETYFIAPCPHKALPRSALLEKHPVRRVGGAEGAAENRVRSTEPLTALVRTMDLLQSFFWGLSI